nr:MAG TPA: hypothetical protein [Caudoviricetes sp.]DAX89936.1 MAG TPA: hypothetical protein [Caudoviricetes sp.]
MFLGFVWLDRFLTWCIPGFVKMTFVHTCHKPSGSPTMII